MVAIVSANRDIFKEMITLTRAVVVPVMLIIYGVASPPYAELESMEESMQESKSALETMMWWAMYCVHGLWPGVQEI